jgi:hypothetical protein
MAARARPRTPRPPAGGGISYSREFLQRLAQILVHAGHSPQALAREFREICATLKEPAHRWDPSQLAYFADLPHVIAHWHADPQYLDSRGMPAPLPLRGRGPSLSALIERVLPGEDPEAVTHSLMRLQGVRRRGALYVPNGRYLTYPRATGRVHGLSALLGMLRTVERNVTRAKAAPILERAALNPSFPVSALPAFHRRLNALAQEFLWNVDGDMRRRETGKGRGPRTRLGVGVFAFEGPLAPSRSPRRPKAEAKGRRARRASGRRGRR